MIARFNIVHLFWLTLAVAFSACRSSKELAREEPVKSRSAVVLVNRLEKNSFEFDFVGMKLDSDFRMDDQNDGFKANLRMRKDSIIWISISPALGVEMIRMLITPDSVKYLSKIPNNKHFYIGDYTSIEDFLGIDADFQMLQALLVGNPVDFDPKDDKYKSRVEDNQHVLTSKYKRRMEKVVGVDFKELEPSRDSIFVDPSDKDYLKLVEKKDEDDLIIKRYFINPNSFKLERTIFNDLFNNRSLVIEHGAFQNSGEQIYPTKTSIEVQDLNRTQRLDFEITRLKENKEFDFPFEIPKDYERKYY